MRSGGSFCRQRPIHLARSMGLIAMFGIENSGLALAVNLLLLF